MPSNVGLSAEGLYIDTEKSFRPERIESMALNALKRYKDLNPNVSVDYLKSRVHLKECFDDAKQLLQMIDQQIEPFIEMNPKIRLIVIDSIAQHFRYDYKGKDYERDYELAQIAYKLKHLALSKKIAVSFDLVYY
jgi:DNA repair protein RadA